MSAPYSPGRLTKLYYSFKSLPLPWRRKFFKGFDLDGNEFYESYNALHPTKPRRTVKYVKDGHYTDNQVTPQWMSWLRYTRPQAPTLEELRQEVYRIQSTRQNAALVSARWEEERARLNLTAPVGTAADAPGIDEGRERAQSVERQNDRMETLGEARKQEESIQGRKNEDASQSDYIPAPGSRDEKGEWQPESWTPGPARRS